MQPQDIRLRLLVRRHGLPEVKLVWPCSCSEDLTIAKLLEQVNEVVPLESGEWGLEDYAVELADGTGGSFECLHFQQVGRILKDEDQVLIRSLLTGDLKRRRLSGRHQISDDGRHLVDGLAFGRSWIRAPHDRPHVELPPRKRIRVNYEDEDDDEEEEEQEPFLIGAPRSSRDDRHQNFRTKNSWEGSLASQLYEQYLNESSASGSVSEENELEDDIDDEDEIEDYTDEEDEDEAEDGDLETELQLLREEAAADVSNYAQRYSDSFRDDMRHSGARGYSGAFDRNLTLNSASQGPDSPSLYSGMFSTSFTPSTAHGYASVPVEVLITVFQTAFPTLNGEIRTALKRTNKDLRKAYMSLTMLCEPSLTFDQMMDGASLILAPFTRRGGNAHLPRPTVEDETSRSPLGLLNRRTRKRLIEEVEEEDEVGCSPDTSANGVSLFVSQLNQSQHTGSDEIARADLDEVDEDSAEDDSSSDSESDSSDNSLDSGSSSEEEDRQMPGPPAATYPDGDEPSDVDEESSDDDSDSSVDVGAQSTADHVGNDEVESSSSSSDASSSEPSESDSVSDSDSTSGDSESESESEDESESKSKSESASEVEEMSSKRPVPATVAQSTAASAPPLPIQAPQVEDSKTQTSDKPPTTGLTRTQKRNARRRRIKALKELHSDQAELTTGTAGDAAGEDFLARKKALLAAIIDEPHEDDTANDEAHMRDVPLPDKAGESGTMAPDAGQAATPELKDTPAKRHSRIDMGAGRRLVFGALGLKPPANKSDEQKIRDTLMKDVRPLVNPRTLPSNGDNGINEPPSNAEPNEGEDEDQDAWREKINYRAVECCHEDMVLSEPPFPFVQRWDPQQRRDVIRKRKRASENYEADDSYIDSTYYYDKQPEENHPVPETRKRSKTNKGKSVSLQIASPHEDEEDVTLNYDEAPPKSSQFTDVDDLPSLPKDVKSLPPLAPGTAKPGMVITWNQLVMSKATNWQPEVMPLTGLVVSGGEEGEIHVILARRDREDSEKTYDEVTGERVYGKFEVPDLDEEDQEEDSGLRSLKWTEMMEPRLLQQAPADVVAQPAMGATEATVEDATSLSGQNKVSEPLSGEDGLDSGLSTGEVRAALEDELMHDSFGTQANLETFSIQSGQQLPRLDASMSEVHISTASNSFEHVGHAHSKPDARSEHVLIATSNLQKAHSPKLNHWVERDDEPAADREAELGPSLADAMAEESSNTLASKRSDEASAVEMVEEGDGDEGERGSTHGDSGLSMAKPSDAVIASSHFSVASGRQPQTSYSIHAGLQDETIIPETLPQPRETTPMQSQTRSQTSPSSRASSSPFPSLEQIFMSAQPTQSSGRKNESPSMSASLSAPARDAEYEEAMRKLDEGHESDVALEIKKQEEEEDTAVERKLFPNATQPPSRMKDIDEGVALPQLPLSQAEKGTDGKPPFFIPAGSQVIVLSSSPPSGSGVPDEDHETMEDKEARAAPTGGSLPTGPGWVRKGNRHERQVSSAKKADATTASPRSGRRTRRGNEPLSMTPLVSPLKKNTGRRSGSSMWQ